MCVCWMPWWTWGMRDKTYFLFTPEQLNECLLAKEENEGACLVLMYTCKHEFFLGVSTLNNLKTNMGFVGIKVYRALFLYSRWRRTLSSLQSKSKASRTNETWRIKVPIKSLNWQFIIISCQKLSNCSRYIINYNELNHLKMITDSFYLNNQNDFKISIKIRFWPFIHHLGT